STGPYYNHLSNRVDWSPQSVKVSTLVTNTGAKRGQSNEWPYREVFLPSPATFQSSTDIRDNFSSLPWEARKIWNKFENEMNLRPELKGKLLRVDYLTVGREK